MAKAKARSRRSAREKTVTDVPVTLAPRAPGEPPLPEGYVRMMREVARELGDDRVVVPEMDGHPRRFVRPAELPIEGRLVVPIVDDTGAALSRRSVACWHLMAAWNLLRMEYSFHSEDKGAADLERAAGVAMQLYLGLAPGTPESDRKSMRRMANEAHASRLKIRTKDAEDRLLAVLPPSASEARKRFGEDGIRKVAQIALMILASHPHPGAAKMHRRWSVTDGRFFNSPKFQDDADELASQMHELLLEEDRYDGNRFAHEVVKRMFKILGLGRALGALEIKKRRSRP